MASERDVRDLISKLKECPSYQFDNNHAHCGPRKLLIAGLTHIQDNLRDSDIGVCLDCFFDPNRALGSWNSGRTRLHRYDVQHVIAMGGSIVTLCSASGPQRLHRHIVADELFTAVEIKWFP